MGGGAAPIWRPDLFPTSFQLAWGPNPHPRERIKLSQPTLIRNTGYSRGVGRSPGIGQPCFGDLSLFGPIGAGTGLRGPAVRPLVGPAGEFQGFLPKRKTGGPRGGAQGGGGTQSSISLFPGPGVPELWGMCFSRKKPTPPGPPPGGESTRGNPRLFLARPRLSATPRSQQI